MAAQEWRWQQLRYPAKFIMTLDNKICLRVHYKFLGGGEIMGPVTTNPWLIAVINMVIVFGVLIALGLLMSLLQVLDPTKTKTHS